MKNGGTFAEIIKAQDKASKEYLGEDDESKKQECLDLCQVH